LTGRIRLLVAAIFLAGFVGHLIAHQLFAFDDRAPRLLTITVAVIGLRWGSVAGGYFGALGGLLLALYAGEPPFPGTAGMAAAGWLAGGIPARFVIETYRGAALAIVTAALFELVLVSSIRGATPPNSLRVALWSAGWALVLGLLLYGLVRRWSAAPPISRLPKEILGKE